MNFCFKSRYIDLQLVGLRPTITLGMIGIKETLLIIINCEFCINYKISQQNLIHQVETKGHKNLIKQPT